MLRLRWNFLFQKYQTLTECNNICIYDLNIIYDLYAELNVSHDRYLIQWSGYCVNFARFVTNFFTDPYSQIRIIYIYISTCNIFRKLG